MIDANVSHRGSIWQQEAAELKTTELDKEETAAVIQRVELESGRLAPDAFLLSGYPGQLRAQ